MNRPTHVPARIALGAVILGLSACASVPRATAPIPTLTCEPMVSRMAACVQQIEALRVRATQLSDVWAFTGRAAIRHGSQSGSVDIDWEDQAASGYTVALSAPLTGQAWRLHEVAGRATLEGLKGGTRAGNDGASLLRQATGFEIPVGSLRAWVRGVPDAARPVDRYLFANGVLVGLEQGGWRIDYPQRAADGLPTRINAARPDDGVRLAIDRWDVAAP